MGGPRTSRRRAMNAAPIPSGRADDTDSPDSEEEYRDSGDAPNEDREMRPQESTRIGEISLVRFL